MLLAVYMAMPFEMARQIYRNRLGLGLEIDRQIYRNRLGVRLGLEMARQIYRNWPLNVDYKSVRFRA